MDESQIQALEKLLNQSIMGFHHLFDHTQVAAILKKPTEEIDFFTSDNIEKVQKLFTQLIQKNTIEEKRAFIESLRPDKYEILLRTYFHIVESTLLSSERAKH